MLGDDTFIEQTLRAVQGGPVKPPTLSQFLDEICSRRGLDGATLGSATRSHAYVEGRALLTYLATELHSATLSEVAQGDELRYRHFEPIRASIPRTSCQGSGAL